MHDLISGIILIVINLAKKKKSQGFLCSVVVMHQICFIQWEVF